MQSSPANAVLGIHISPCLQQQFNGFCFAVSTSPMQSGPAIVVLGIHISPSLQQQFNGCCFAVATSPMQSSLAIVGIGIGVEAFGSEKISQQWNSQWIHLVAPNLLSSSMASVLPLLLAQCKAV